MERGMEQDTEEIATPEDLHAERAAKHRHPTGYEVGGEVA